MQCDWSRTAAAFAGHADGSLRRIACPHSVLSAAPRRVEMPPRTAPRAPRFSPATAAAAIQRGAGRLKWNARRGAAAPARAVNGVEVGRCCELPNETMKRQEPCGAKTAGVGMRTHPKARAMNSGRWQPAFTPNDLRFKPRDLHPITGQHAARRRPTLRVPTSRAADRVRHRGGFEGRASQPGSCKKGS